MPGLEPSTCTAHSVADKSCFQTPVWTVWLLDPPWFYKLIWNIFKWLLKKKLRDRIHLVSKTNEADMAKLRASFDPANLPVKLGGTLPDPRWQWTRRR